MSRATLIPLCEVSARLGVKRAAVLRLVRRGKLAGLRVGSVWRFDPADVDAFIEQAKAAARPTDSPAPPAPRPSSRARSVAEMPGANRYH